MRKPILLILLVFGITLLPSPAHAQTDPGINLQISPLPIEINSKPGTSTTSDLRIRNGGTKPEKLKATLKAFSAEGPAGDIVFRDPGPGDEFVNWVKLDKTVFDAPAGEWQTVKMTVSLPKTAAFGYHWAVQFQRATPVNPKPGTTGIEGAVAIFVLANAEAPGAVRKAEVVSFKADRKFYEFLPAKFSVQLRNTGNVHIAPQGNIFIRRGKSQVSSIVVNGGEGKVLPKSNRIFTSEWKDGFPVYENVSANGQPVTNGKGEPKRKLKWNLSNVPKLRFGKYTADLVMIYNDGQRDIPISGSVSFWVVPWRLIIGLLVVAIFVTIGLWSTFKKIGRFGKKTLKKDHRV